MAKIKPIRCPVCKAIIEINTSNWKIIKHVRKEDQSKTADDIFSEKLKAVKESKGKAEEQFKKAKEEEKDKKKKLDELFEEGKKKVEEEGDTGPSIRDIDLD